MLLKYLIKSLPIRRQFKIFKKHGLFIGSRIRQGRILYLYMVENLFAEIVFSGDSEENEPELINFVSGLTQLNQHLEREIHLVKA